MRVCMKILAIACISVVGLGGTAWAQPPVVDIEWTREFGTLARATDTVQAVDVDAAGNVLVAGSTGGTLPGQVSAGGADAFVRMYDPGGVEIWTRQFGTAGNDQALAVFVDDTGVYVAGLTAGTLTGETSAGGTDAFVRRYDASGATIWTRQFGTVASDLASGLSVDPGGVYVVGRTDGALPGQTSSGSGDAFVRKYDFDGNTGVYAPPALPDESDGWTRQFGSAVSDSANGVAAGPGGVYVAGQTDFALPGQAGSGARDAFVRKYNAAGAVVWTRQFGTAALDEASCVAVDASGVYVAGRTDGALAGPTAGFNDAFVRKYDESGTALWTRQFGTPILDQALAISVHVGAVYVAGITDGALSGSSSGGRDAFARAYDVDGLEIWSRQFGTLGFDQAFGVSADAGGVLVAGQTTGAFPGETNTGSADAFVRRFDAGGTAIWTRQFGTIGPATDTAQAVAADAHGSLYVAGGTGGSLPGQTSAGGTDVFVRKYDAGGLELWTRQFGTIGLDQALGVSVDASGVYVAGQAGATLPGQTSSGGTDAFVRKYDVSGAVAWTRQFGTSGLDQAFGVVVESGAVYVIGQTTGTFLGQVSVGSVDAFLRKYDANGTEVWTRQFGTVLPDQALAVSADACGVYVAGQVGGTLPGQASALGPDAFVRKYDAEGNEVWTSQFGTTSVVDFAFAVVVDPGGVYVAGQVGGALPGQTSAGATDAYVRKYDAGGSELWTVQLGTAVLDRVSGIDVDATGVYVAGQTDGTLPDQTGAGGTDAFVRKYDPDGVERWTLQLGTAAFDTALSIALDATGAYVAGMAGASADAFVTKLVEIIPVAIDIKPGASPNNINLGSNGVVPVAVLSTATFDARTVDPLSVTLAGAAVRLNGKGRALASVKDVDEDGLLDLLVHVSTEALQLVATDAAAVLEGVTVDGRRIRGVDTIRIVP